MLIKEYLYLSCIESNVLDLKAKGISHTDCFGSINGLSLGKIILLEKSKRANNGHEVAEVSEKKTLLTLTAFAPSFLASHVYTC
jgi:hypothetical protein